MAQENTDRVFLLTDLSLKVRHRRIGGVQHLLRLQHIQLGSKTVVEPQLGQLDGIFLGLHRVARDLEFEIELQQREVVARHIANKGEYDSIPRILGSQELGPRSLGGTSQTTEEIQLECRIGGECQNVVGRLAGRIFSACEVTVRLHLGNKLERVMVT